MGKRIVTAVKQRFSIRKLSIGAASVLLGTSLYFMGGSATIVHADTNVSGDVPQTGTSKEPASGQTGEENGSTEVKDPVKVAKDPTKDDTDVNQAIDDYANQKQKEQDEAGNKVVIRPSGKQPEKAADNATDRGTKVEHIKDSIDGGIAAANNEKAAIEDYKNKHQNQQILNGEESEAFKNQGLSVDDERNSKINKVTITDTKDKTKTKEVDTTVIDGPSQKIEIDGKKDAIVITHAGPDKMTDKEKDIMQIKSDNKVIIDLNDKYQNKDITVTYSNLNNSYYLENMGDETDRIKISRIERTFSGIQATDDPKLFNPNGSDSYKKDGIYDKCDGPQLIIYKDPSDGFFYNNIKQVSVKDIYYDDKGKQIVFKDGDKNKAWIFVTSLNSDGVGNNNHRGDGKEYVEKVKAENPDGTPADIEKIAGSTVTGPVDENTTKEFTRTVELFDGHSNGEYLRNYLRTNADALKTQGWIWKDKSSELTQTVTLHVKKTDAGYVYDNENAFFKGLKLPSISENGTEKYPDIEIPEVRVGTKTAVRIRVSYSANNPHTPTPLDKTEVGVDEDKATDTHDGWWYSDESNSHDQNNYPDWDNKSEDNRYAFVGAVAIQYQPGMTITYGADDTAWGSHWACTQTQVVSTLNERVIIYDHIKDGIIPVTPDKPGKPGEPIDLNDPDPKRPVWPEGTDKDSLAKTGTQTICYVDANGNALHDNNTQRFTFTKNMLVDKVTGKIIDPGIWNKPEHTFDAVNTPEIDGYHVVNKDFEKSAGSTTIKPDDLNKIITVVYEKNPTQLEHDQSIDASQRVEYVDENGQELQQASTDSDNFIYSGDTVDQVTHEIIKQGSWNKTQREFDAVEIPVIKGYVAISGYQETKDGKYVAGGFTATNTQGKDDRNQIFKVVYKKVGKIVPVDPNHTPIPDAKTPNYQNDPDDPTKVTKDEPTPAVPGMHTDTPNVTPKYPTTDTEVVYEKNPTQLEHDQSIDASQRVEYVDENGQELQQASTDSDNFIYSGDTVDQVTHEIIKQGSWNKTQREFDAVEIPVIKGYVAISGYQETKDGKYVAGGFTATNTQGKDDRNQIFKVVYKKVGKIVPVDPNHTPIPDAKTPNYQNDPDDPTKVTKDEPTPAVPGMHTDTPNVTPKYPTTDTEVVYEKDVKDVTTVVHYIDEDDGNKVIFSSENLTGKEGTQIGYKSANDLKALTDKGYVFDVNGYDPDGKAPNFDSKVPVYEIKLEHGKVTVTPKNPGNPGNPINPNYPNGPKWPDDTDANSLTKTGTQTIRYVGAGDKTPADNTQTYTFTKSMVIDKVTGKVLDPGSWNVESHTLGTVKTPVIPGYHADKDVAGGETVTPDDLNKVITVTYIPDGNPGAQGDTPTPEPTPEPEPTPNSTPDDQPDSEISSDEHFENVKSKDKLNKTNPKKVDAYKKERKIIKTKIAKQGHTEIAEPIEDKVTRENNVKVVSDPVENKAAEPKLPQTGEADNSIIGLLGMLLASFAAIFGFDSLHSHD